MLRCIGLACAFITVAAAVEADPGTVQKTLYDLNQLEPQIAHLHPGDVGGIHHVQHLLDQTANRFQTYATPADPNYGLAMKRLSHAQHELAQIENTPGGPPPPPGGPIVVLPGGPVGGGPGAPLPPMIPSPNPQVDHAEHVMAQLNAAIDATAPYDAPRIAQEDQTLEQLRSTLQATYSPIDPGWASAQNAFNEVAAKMNALIAASQNPPPPPGYPAPAYPAPGVDPAVAHAEQQMAQLDPEVQSLNGADGNQVRHLVYRIDHINQELGADPNQNTPDWSNAESNLFAMRRQVVDTRMAALDQAVEQEHDRFVMLPPYQIHVSDNLASRQRLTAYYQEANAIGTPDDGNVTNLESKIQQTIQVIDQWDSTHPY